MYNGGKNNPIAWQTIINQMPPHRIYIEAFLGSGAVMKHKLPAQKNFGFDLDRKVINDYHASAAYEVVNSCAISYLEHTLHRAGVDVLVYLDPPYPKCSRRSQKDLYQFEMTDKQHERLLAAIKFTDAKIIISTLQNELYSTALADWRIVTFDNPTRHGIQKELLYMNFPAPEALHDYRFLGTDKSDKQRIRRKIQRHVNTLKRLPAYERQAIIQAINNCHAG